MYKQMYFKDQHTLENKVSMPDLQIGEYTLEITVLGLRGLISPGLLPIKKAYVKFSVKSILPPAQSKAVSDIFTEPGETGPDPNIKTSLKFLANIPGIEEYCPRMTCNCYDKIYFDGMAQPMIGTFTLKIGDILRDTRKKDREVMELFNLLTTCLEKVIDTKSAIKGTDRDLTITQILN